MFVQLILEARPTLWTNLHENNPRELSCMAGVEVVRGVETRYYLGEDVFRWGKTNEVWGLFVR